MLENASVRQKDRTRSKCGSSPIIFTQYISFSFLLLLYFILFYGFRLLVHYWDHHRSFFVCFFFFRFLTRSAFFSLHLLIYVTHAFLQHNLRLFKVMTNLKSPKRIIWTMAAQVFRLYHSSWRPSPIMTLRIFLGAQNDICMMRCNSINFMVF